MNTCDGCTAYYVNSDYMTKIGDKLLCNHCTDLTNKQKKLPIDNWVSEITAEIDKAIIEDLIEMSKTDSGDKK